MNPRVKEVYPNQDYTIKVIFDNGEEKLFDVSPYLDILFQIKCENFY